jgi:predicted TPR repeat methyltransferase
VRVTDGWAQVYDDLAPTYDEMTAGNGWSANQRARDLLAPLGLTPARVLDLGAGTGQTAAVLHELFPAAALTLVDPSPGMLELARGRVPDAEVVAADAESFLRARDAPWDLVMAIGFLELLPDLFEVLRLVAGRLAPGAHLVVSHEPLLDDGSVQASPVSVVSGDHRVRRHPVDEVERRAASYGLERVASDVGVAFERSDDGPAVYEIVVWRAPSSRT